MHHKPRKWIFIRGLGRHSGHWGHFVEHFQKFFPKDEIEFLDLRGNGSLAHSPSFVSMTDNVRDLRARSKFINSGHSVYLMTISLGSMAGVEWAHMYPDEIEGLVTINTSDRGTSPFFERMRPGNYLSVLHFLGKTWPIGSKVSSIETMEADKADLQGFPATTRSNFARQLVSAGTYEFPKHKPKTELLLLCSDGDRLVSSQCSKRIAEMWTLKPHVHPTAGHDLPIEAPEWVCREISNWLELHQLNTGDYRRATL